MHCPSTPDIEKLDLAAAVLDQSGALQGQCRGRDSGAPHAEHVGEKLPGESQRVAAGKVARTQQPATQAGFDMMRDVAGRRLLGSAQTSSAHG